MTRRDETGHRGRGVSTLRHGTSTTAGSRHCLEPASAPTPPGPRSRGARSRDRVRKLLAGVLAPLVLAAAAACGGEAADSASAAGGGEDAAADEAARQSVPAPPGCDELAAIPADSMEAEGEEGLRVLARKQGEGRAASAGDTVVVHYVGCLTDGTKFDASYDRNEPFSFPLGRGKVIAGWDRGLQGMKPGGVRVLRIPPELAYGSRGTPQGPIPPDATLVFHVRMTELKPGGGSDGA